MIPVSMVALITLAYFALLFGVAFWADLRKKQGRSIISNPTIYTLSLAVYCTSWTFYGSVGRAATSGLDFLTVYIGPTLMAFGWWFFLRKILRICKEQKIVSIADFISSRYGKSVLLGAMVTVFAGVGIMPYIALQLKAVSHTFDLLSTPLLEDPTGIQDIMPSLPGFVDTTFVLALILGLFSVLFGARHLDASERHEGLVAAIALESVVKLLAFLGVGLFVTYGIFAGFQDIFDQFLTRFPGGWQLVLLDTPRVSYLSWFSLIVISMMAFMFLPRQFQIMVIENTNEEHITKAMWRFPVYLFLLNLFVLPIALGGLLLTDGDTSRSDYFVIYLPLLTNQPWLAMLAFIGGFSASAGMVMVSSVALATMILNNLIMPAILRLPLFQDRDLSRLLINLKRIGIFVTIFCGYLFYKAIGASYALVHIGFISFIAATQFAPSLIGGLFWKRANLLGAATGLVLGFIIWFYTLLIPSFVRSGWINPELLQQGLFDLDILRPLQLFGLNGLDMWSHTLLWSLLFNIGAFVSLSILTGRDAVQKEQATKFVDVFRKEPIPVKRQRLSKAPTVMEFVELMGKFIGEERAQAAIHEYLGDREISEYDLPDLKRFTERTLAGSVGSAPARIIVDNYLATRGSKMEDVFDIFGSVSISRAASREQLGVLFEASRLVSSGGNLQTIFDSILDLLIAQFKLDLCVIRILNQDKNVLQVRSQKGMSSRHLSDSDREVSKATTIGECFLTNSVQVVNDTDTINKPTSARIMREEGIKSFAHAPIRVEDEPIGVLSAFSRTEKGIFSDEFIELFKSLAAQLGVAWRNAIQTEHIISAREQERELEIAKSIQLGLLPKGHPDIPGITLAAECVPARQVGGDYYDYLQRNDNSLDLIIADVSGHNVAAALIMAETRTFIQARAKGLKTSSQVLSALNRFFYDNLTRAEMFITMFYLKYHPDSRSIAYANAGHNMPILWRHRKQSSQRLDTEGLILGMKSEVSFEEKTTQLEPGDILVLFTDGISEAENEQREFFGEQRLCTLVQEKADAHPQAIIDHILNQVRDFTGTQTFKDDVSLVVLRVKEGNEGMTGF